MLTNHEAPFQVSQGNRFHACTRNRLAMKLGQVFTGAQG